MSPSTTSPYPFAAAPDIVRAHQKDSYFTGHLASTITDLHRRVFGARSAHALASDLHYLASLLYFCLTTLPGNRTLGEEFCDLVQVESPVGQIPDISKRAAYIGGTIILPYLTSRTLPKLRNRVRGFIQQRLDELRKRRKQESRDVRIWQYIANHLSSLTSAAPVRAVTLALFYFNGTYYELTKRLLAFRYVFLSTGTVSDSSGRGGYEVLGVLLAIQLAVQGYLHIRTTASSLVRRDQDYASEAFETASINSSLDHANTPPADSDLLLTDMGTRVSQQGRTKMASVRLTPIKVPHVSDLSDAKIMAYVKGSQRRKCTLCLEEFKDPSATSCGHVFCWKCIGDWVQEKPECPLCRREAVVQHILPLRVM